MTSLTVHLPDDKMRHLRERASRLGLTVEEMAQRILEDAARVEIVSSDSEDFRRSADQTLAKNAELYRRLA